MGHFMGRGKASFSLRVRRYADVWGSRSTSWDVLASRPTGFWHRHVEPARSPADLSTAMLNARETHQEGDSDMEQVQARVPQTDNFDDFLYADVSIQANGMPVTVLSLLARRGLEPWTEAKRLADLPRWVAIDELARTLDSEKSVWSPAPQETASQLVLLLPKGGRSGSDLVTPPINREMPRLWFICGVIGVLYAFGIVVVNASYPKAEPESSKVTVADSWSKTLRLREGAVEGSKRDSAAN